MTINEWRDAIHALAISKGWWPDESPLDEICSLIISELSEALEEYRNGKGNLYYLCTLDGVNDDDECADDAGSCYFREREGVCDKAKPCGITVEMADALIRILDYAGRKGIDMDRVLKINPAKVTTLSEALMSITRYITGYWAAMRGNYWENPPHTRLYLATAHILAWFERESLDVWEIVALKHEYNKTRPVRHGGKVC